MLSKELLNDIQSLHQEILGRSISECEAEVFAKALVSIRDASSFFNIYPKHAISCALSNYEFNGRVCYACDVLELRGILEGNSIVCPSKIILLSRSLAEKLVRSHKCIIVLNLDPEKVAEVVVGGIAVVDNCSLDIKDKIHSVIANKKSPRNEIARIVSETAAVPVYNSYFIPMLDVETYASSDSIMKEAQIADVQIQLNPQEEQIFSVLRDVVQQEGLQTQMRVAGGWVRDKLMGKESDDIDIALDDMTGSQFWKHVQNYAQKNPNAPIGKHYVVDQNVEKSKHLETTAIEIGGMKIDFVNLRSESYGDDSRVPTMEFGDPKTDAERRDLTINSLFYNINTGQVEDYVGGLEDLENGVLRTPLDPVKTFMDDPLRMLRLLRFYSRYDGFKIDPQAMEAMGNPDVHEAYRSKVAPERAGPEIMKMFSGTGPERSIRALYETGMDAAILNLPDFENLNPFNMDQMNPNHQLNLQEHTLRVMGNYNDLLMQQGVEGKDRALALMASWFHDFGKMHPEIQKPRGFRAPKDDDPGDPGDPNHMSYIGHEDVSMDLGEAFMKSIGIGKNDRDFVNTIVREHMYPHSHDGGWSKKQMGKLRGKTQIPGQERDDIWKFVMWHAHADAAAKSHEAQLEHFPEYVERFDATQEYMNQPPPMKPVVDGRTLMQMFPNISPKTGFIKVINDRLMEEQSSGNITTIEQGTAFVESIRPEIEAQFGGTQEGTMANTWYELAKQADASSGAGPEGFNHYEGQEPWTTDDDDQVHMVRRTPEGAARYRRGDTVRNRYNKRRGKVQQVSQGRMLVKWDKEEDPEEFDLTSVDVPMKIERV